MSAILTNPISRRLLLGVMFLVIAINLIVKFGIERGLNPGESWWLIGDWLGLEHVRNSGIAFGIGSGSTLIALIVVPFAVGLLIWMLVAGHLEASRWGLACIGLILGGALGNALDRLGDGYVTDYIAVGPWPRFNIADSALTVGVLLIVVRELRTSGTEVRDSV